MENGFANRSRMACSVHPAGRGEAAGVAPPFLAPPSAAAPASEDAAGEGIAEDGVTGEPTGIEPEPLSVDGAVLEPAEALPLVPELPSMLAPLEPTDSHPARR
jgi:hypothetical protein